MSNSGGEEEVTKVCKSCRRNVLTDGIDVKLFKMTIERGNESFTVQRNMCAQCWSFCF